MVKNSSSIPQGVWILAVLSFLSAVSFLVLSLQMLFVSDALRGTLGLPLADPITQMVTGYISSGVFLMIGLAFVCFAILAYYVGRGLLASKLWAKIIVGIVFLVVLALSILGLANALYLSGLFGLIVSGGVIWYLFIRVSSKKFFK